MGIKDIQLCYNDGVSGSACSYALRSFYTGEYFIQHGINAWLTGSDTSTPLLYGYVDSTGTTTQLHYATVGTNNYDAWAYSDGTYIYRGGTTDINDGVIRSKWNGSAVVDLEETVCTNTGSVNYGIMTNRDKIPGYGISFGNSTFERNHSIIEIDNATPAYTEDDQYTQDSIRGSYFAMDFRTGNDVNTPTYGDVYVIGSNTGAKPMTWKLNTGTPPTLTYLGCGSTAVGATPQDFGWDRDNHLIYDHENNLLFNLNPTAGDIDAGTALTSTASPLSGPETGSVYASTFTGGILVIVHRPGSAGTTNYLESYSLDGTVATLLDQYELGTTPETDNCQMQTSPYTGFVYLESNNSTYGGIYKVSPSGTISLLWATRFANSSGSHYHAFDFIGPDALPAL